MIVEMRCKLVYLETSQRYNAFDMEKMDNDEYNVIRVIEQLFVKLDILCLSVKTEYRNENEHKQKQLISSYEEGLIICQKYFYSIYDLEKFCEEILNINLGCFLKNNLPQEFTKKIIQHYESSNTDEEKNKI